MADLVYSRDFFESLRDIVYQTIDLKKDRYDALIFEPIDDDSEEPDFIDPKYIKSLGMPRLIDGLFQTKRIIEENPALHGSGDYFIDINEARHDNYTMALKELLRLGIISKYTAKEWAPLGMMEYQLFDIKRELLAFLYLYIKTLDQGEPEDEAPFGVKMILLDRLTGFISTTLMAYGKFYEIQKALEQYGSSGLVKKRKFKNIKLECYYIAFSQGILALIHIFKQVASNYRTVIRNNPMLFSEEAYLSNSLQITQKPEVHLIRYSNFIITFDAREEDGFIFPLLQCNNSILDFSNELELLKGTRDDKSTVGNTLRMGGGFFLGIFKEIGNDPGILSQSEIIIEKGIQEWMELIQSSGLFKRKAPTYTGKENFETRFSYFLKFIAKYQLDLDIKMEDSIEGSIKLIISTRESSKLSQKGNITKLSVMG